MSIFVDYTAILDLKVIDAGYDRDKGTTTKEHTYHKRVYIPKGYEKGIRDYGKTGTTMVVLECLHLLGDWFDKEVSRPAKDERIHFFPVDGLNNHDQGRSLYILEDEKGIYAETRYTYVSKPVLTTIDLMEGVC